MDIPAERKAIIASCLKDKAELESKAYSIERLLANIIQPALEAYTDNKKVTFKNVALYDNLGGYDGEVFSVVFEYSDGEEGSAFIPAHIVYAEDRAGAVAEYRRAKRAKDDAAMAARIEAERLKKYSDAGLSPEEINTIENLRIRLAANG